MWRDYSSLLLKGSRTSEEIKIPGVIDWAMELHRSGFIPYSMIKIRTTGVTYDSNSSSVVSMIDDSLSINTQLLSDFNDKWNHRISQSISTIEEGVKCIGSFQSDLLECDGYKWDDPVVKSRRDYIKSEAYYRMDQPFRRWLASINPSGDDIEETIGRLYTLTRDILIEMGKEMMEEANNTALVGREKDTPSGTKKYKNAFKSYKQFEGRLYKTFGGVN